MVDPRSSQLGTTTDQPETKHRNDQMSSSSSHLSPVASPALATSAPATVLVESVSHEDSAISHPRDQDYLSLWVGEGSEVELQQALSIYGG